MADHNARFAKQPANPKDLHRALTGRDNLDEAFTWRTTRTVNQSLTLQYDRVVYILEQTPEALAAAGKLAEVIEYPGGGIVIRHNGATLRYRVFDKERRVSQAAVVENKFFGPLLAHIREEQIRRDAASRPRRSIRPAAASLSR